MIYDLSHINPKQVLFFKARARHVGYGGARGGGKSWAMRMKFVALAMRYPGLKLLLLRRTLPELRENHILPLLSMLTGVAHYSAEEKAFAFPNGSRLKLGYCDTERDVYQYQGQEYDVVGFEEATLFMEAQIQFILTCNRSTRRDFSPRAYYTMNPGGVSHAYFKRLFVDRQFEGEENPDDYVFIPARVYDNPVLMDNNPEYIAILKSLPEHLRRAHLDGDWDIFVGQVFTEFSRERHVIAPFPLPAAWPRFRSLDWGFAKPYAVYWYAVDHDGVVYIYRELYGWGGAPDTGTKETAREVARKVKAAEAGDMVGFADPACWARTGHDGPTIAEAFAAEGVVWNKADNDRLQGKMQVHLRLKDDKLKIFDSCQHLIRTLPTLVYDEHRPEDVDTSQEDHCLAGSTLAHTEAGRVPIRELVGTEGRVLSHDGQYHGYRDVRMTKPRAPVCEIEFEDGSKVTATGYHPFLMQSGEWKLLRDLAPGDDVFNGGGGVKVKSVKFAGFQDVFNMEVDDTHSFAVESGVVVHNCYDSSRYGLMSRPWIPERPKKQQRDAWAYDDEAAPKSWMGA